MAENMKYIHHKDLGLPIRIPPYLRREIRKGTTEASVQLGMIQQSPVAGERSSIDCLPVNLEEIIRLRRIARKVSRELVRYANNWGVERYCTVVHGSVARCLVRQSDCDDPSDLDIDLVIDDMSIHKEDRRKIRDEMYGKTFSYGARIDSYVWNFEEMKRNKGEYARLYLGAAAYPVANPMSLWEDIVWVGLSNQCYLNLRRNDKRRIAKIIDIELMYQLPREMFNLVLNAELGEKKGGF